MKYTSANPPLQCFMRQSTWYKDAGTMVPKGVLWHSTGANNPTLRRYVQPDDNAANRVQLLELLGTNANHNDWNHVVNYAGVNAFIGKLANEEVATIQTGPWDKAPWGCGPGKYGSCNSNWIQFEICEDGLNDPVYFEKVYRDAVELTAYLCKLYNLDPQGAVTHCGVKGVPVILCHQDSYQLGLGSNHGDVLHWLPKFGKSMQTVRNDVAALLAETNNNEEDDDMVYYKTLNDVPSYYKDAVQKAMEKGALNGTGDGINVSEDLCRTLTILDRLGKLD